jgi:signal transduction histidine kinase
MEKNMPNLPPQTRSSPAEKDCASDISLLKSIVANALQSQSVEESVAYLSKAFTLFSEESNKLKNAYAKLQEQFLTVNQELSMKVKELGRLTHYLNNILMHISDSILFITLDGTITIFNSSAQKSLKKEPQNVLFQKFWVNFPDDFFGFSMKEALTFGIAHKLLYQKDLEISTTFVYEGPKAYHGMILIFRDITEKQKLQLIANRNDRMKELGMVAASVAHEIRNPLGGIRGYASLLFRDLEEQKHLQEMAGYIIEGTKSLENVVRAILHFSKPIQIEVQTLDIASFLKQQAKFLKVDPAFPKNVKLELHLSNDLLLVPFDPAILKQALLNLFFNGLQAMPQGGTLSISLLQINDACQIGITDTGIGMDEEQLKHLFSPFFTTKKTGNGLGLVEVQKIVQAHFGSIDVRSRLGSGTTFTITLPMRR